MNDSMPQTEITDPSTDAQMDEQPSKTVAAWKLGYHDGAGRILGVLKQCPSWCNAHWFPEDCGPEAFFFDENYHRHTTPTQVGDIDIVLDEEDNDRPMVCPPQIEEMTLEQARAFAADLVRVCDAFEAAQRHGN